MSKLYFYGGRRKKKKEKKEESAVLEATLATAQAELSLSWSWATVDQYTFFSKRLYENAWVAHICANLAEDCKEQEDD